jgi:hypothetical protein
MTSHELQWASKKSDFVIHPKKKEKEKRKSDFLNIFIIMCRKARPSQKTSNVSVARNCPIDNVIND